MLFWINLLWRRVDPVDPPVILVSRLTLYLLVHDEFHRYTMFQ